MRSNRKLVAAAGAVVCTALAATPSIARSTIVLALSVYIDGGTANSWNCTRTSGCTGGTALFQANVTSGGPAYIDAYVDVQDSWGYTLASASPGTFGYYLNQSLSFGCPYNEMVYGSISATASNESGYTYGYSSGEDACGERTGG